MAHTRVVRSVLVVLALLPLLAACGGADVATAPPSSEHPQRKVPAYFPDAFGGDGQVPALVLRGEHDTALKPYTYCLANGCADGALGLGGPLADVGKADAVAFWFPEDDWTFGATFVQEGVDCARSFIGEVTSTGDGGHEIAPAGPAGRYRVDVFGQKDGRDAAYSFLWTTRHDAPLPDAVTGSAAVFANHDGALDSYGIELGVQNLARYPEHARARIVVTDAAGDSTTVEPHWHARCSDPGQLWFSSRYVDPGAVDATGWTLDDGPFVYDVTLTLDGEDYHAHTVWPDDEDADFAPHATLTWDDAPPVFAG